MNNTRKRPDYSRECKSCKNYFKVRSNNQIFCTEECRDKRVRKCTCCERILNAHSFYKGATVCKQCDYKNKKKKKLCRGCKNLFTTKLLSSYIFCSSECKETFLISARECSTCGVLLPADRFVNMYKCKKCNRLGASNYYKSNKWACAQKNKKYSLEHRDARKKYTAELVNWIVKKCLMQSGFPKNIITPELIELKREHIKLYRLIKKKQKDEKFRIV